MAQQSGTRHAAKLSLLQSSVPTGSTDVLAVICCLAEDDKDLMMIGWFDAAAANRPDLSSTDSHAIALVHQDMVQRTRGKLARVACPSLCSLLWGELLGFGLNLKKPAELAAQALVIDAKSVYDSTHGECWLLQKG